MLNDIKLSTILLFVIVAFLIYCLMYSNDGFSNIENVTENEPKLELEPELEPEPETETNQNYCEQIQFEQNQFEQNQFEQNQFDQNQYATVEPFTSTDLVNEVLAETENKMSVPEIKDVVSESPVLNFQPNDEIDDSGASLDDAFDKPHPDCVKTDVVDLNRNNVKKYSAKDFLPKEINDDWFNTDFSQAKYNINDDKLINTEKYVIGVNTVGQSLKNASYDIRGSINVPKYSVSPWNNSTTEPDYNIKSLY
jgi:hypothetical protein